MDGLIAQRVLLKLHWSACLAFGWVVATGLCFGLDGQQRASLQCRRLYLYHNSHAGFFQT
jgi:membrane-associated phospholipid phosphatase